MKTAAIYARVSGDQQRRNNTIASQTEALLAFARERGYSVSADRIFEDDGLTGAFLERPGLERVRDLAAEGRIEAIVVYEPGRLSRNYAYQVLLMEEWARNGVETVFVRAPASATPEDRLAIQLQSMLAEYERAQMLERSRRGKRHRAQRGEVSILGGAPYGYRYWKKTADSDAWYEVVEPQASVVREVFAYYTVDHLSIGAIVRKLNERGVRTASGRGRWERSTVWGMLRNPAYKGRACFGKTRVAPRQRTTRALRQSGGVASRNCAGHERPRDEWIEIPVPAIIPEATFALAEERLARNKKLSARKTRTPSVAQGIASCGKCGYAMSRTSARTSARKISYYRCLGSDSWRHLNGPLCDNRPVRQDLLDDVVWNEILRLLENPCLIQSEIDRRMEAAQNADPNRQREQKLSQSLVRTHKGIERLVHAYQEALITLEELRQRLPELRSRESALKRELQSVKDHVRERETYLRLTETLEQFLERLRHSAKLLEVPERQRIVRLLVKEVLVADDTITIRHSIPIPEVPPQSPAKSSEPGANPDDDKGYLLCTRSHRGTLWRPFPVPARPVRAAFAALAVILLDRHFQPRLDEAEHPAIAHATGDARHQFGMGYLPK